MPSQTFLNLPKNKQNIIVEASLKEFKRVLLKDASINKIIKDANISRGSFYNYFTDINDVYIYSLNNYKIKLHDLINELLIANNGNIIETTKLLFEKMIDFSMQNKNQNLMKNIFLNLNYHTDLTNRSNYQNLEEKYKFIELISKINTNNLNIKAEEELFYIIDIISSFIIRGLIEIFLDNSKKQEVKEKLNIQLEILQKGIRKDDGN